MQWVFVLGLVCAVEVEIDAQASLRVQGKEDSLPSATTKKAAPEAALASKGTGKDGKGTPSTTTKKDAGPLWMGPDKVLHSYSEPKDAKKFMVEGDEPPPKPAVAPEEAGHNRAAVFAMKKHADKLYTAGWNGKIMAWQITPGSSPKLLGEMDHGSSVKALALNPQGTILYSAGALGWISRWQVVDDGTENLYKLKETDHNLMMRHGDARVESLIVTKDGKSLLSSGNDGTVMEWNIVDGDGVANTKTFQYSSTVYENVAVNALTFNADGADLYAANENGQIIQFDVASGEQKSSFDTQEAKRAAQKAHGGYGGYVPDPIQAVSTLGADLLFSAGWDGYVRGYSFKDGRWFEVVDSHPATITSSMCAAPLSNLLLTGGNDGKVTVWKANKDEEVQSKMRAPFERGEITVEQMHKAGWVLEQVSTLHHGAQVDSITMSKDEKRVFSGGFDGRVVEWDSSTWHPVSSMNHHNAEVMTFDPGSTTWTIVTSATPAPPVQQKQTYNLQPTNRYR